MIMPHTINLMPNMSVLAGVSTESAPDLDHELLGSLSLRD